MGAFITKQPNGRYCRFSTIVDCPTDWNMTKEDYIQLCMEKAKEEALKTLENLRLDFKEVLRYYYPNNMSMDEFKQFLEDVGYEGEFNFE